MTTKPNIKTDKKAATEDKAKLKVIVGGNEGKQTESQPAPTARFEVRDDGVFYIGVRYDPSAKRHVEDEPMLLCDRLEIIGRGKDESSGNYRVVRWKSRGDGSEMTYPLPLKDIGERHSWAELRNGGLAVSPNRKRLEILADWLQRDGPDDMYSITGSGGWILGAYILPSGEILGVPNKPLIYNGSLQNADAYRTMGSVEGWKNSVARLCRGNTRPLIAIGGALAAPLLHLANLESGGIHICGTSSDGKSSSIRAAASVWGNPDRQVLTWNTTPLGLCNAGAARNDGLVLLDEIGQGNPKDVSAGIYQLFNGIGKMQGAKEGGNRRQLTWRVFAISTGEDDVPTYLRKHGIRVMAGQEVRLASISTDAGCGLGSFDTLNDEISTETLAQAITTGAKANFGVVGRFFVEYVSQRQGEISKRLREAIQAAKQAMPPNTSGQVYRVVSRFAIAAEALEIAGEAGITGFKPGEATEVINRCVKEWIGIHGYTNREETNVIKQAENWFAVNGLSQRLIDWDFAKKQLSHNPDGPEPIANNCAGWRRRSNGRAKFYINHAAFQDEIANGFDPTYAARVLNKYGMLEVGANVATKNTTLPNGDQQRFYVFVKTEASDT